MDCTKKLEALQVPLDYAARGWAVFPLHSVRNGVCTCQKGKQCNRAGKHPRTHTGLKRATADPKEVRSRWKWETANVGIATGAVSGLVVIDIDPRHSGDETIAKLYEDLGDLPPCPQARTGDGWHLYFRHPGQYVKSDEYAQGIDVKADGGYVVGPPSIHKSGHCYHWEDGVDPDSVELPNLPETWLNWIKTKNVTQGAQGTQVSQVYTGEHRETQDTVREVSSDFVVSDRPAVDARIKTAIEDCLPTATGHRHICIFRLARKLKGFEELKDRSTKELKPIVRQWYKKALPNIATKEWEDSWWDFEETWDKVKFAEGEGIMTEIIERARTAEPPEVAGQYESPKIRLLVSACWELQQHTGDEPFFLSTRTVAGWFDVTPRHAARWLNGLVRDGILELVEKGSNTSRLASSFRYVARK